VPPPKRSIVPGAAWPESHMLILFVVSSAGVLSAILLPRLFDLLGWRRRA